MTLRFTTPVKKPAASASEGARAAWWRERVMGLSRPDLARRLGLTSRTIERYEAMTSVPEIYAQACSGLSTFPTFNWSWPPKERTRR